MADNPYLALVPRRSTSVTPEPEIAPEPEAIAPVAAPEQAEGPNPYLDLVPRRPGIAAQLSKAQEAKPDDYAKSRELAQRTGLPTDLVERNRDEVTRRQTALEAEQALAAAPATKAWLERDPDNLRLASDSVQSLSLIEQGVNILQSYGAQFVDMPGSTLRGWGEAYVAAGRSLTRPIDAVLDAAGMADVKAALHTPLPSWLRPSEMFLSGPGEAIGGVSEAIDVAPEERNFATDVGGALGQVTAQVTAALLVGGPQAIVNAFMLLGQGFEQSAEDVQAEGAQGTPGGDAATLAGGPITALTETAAQKAFLRFIPENLRSRVARATAGFTTEALTEMAEGVMRNLANYVLFSDEPIVDKDVIYEGGVGGTAGAIFSAILPGRQTIRQVQALDDVQKEATASPLTQRDPDKAAEHLGAALRDAGVEVYIPVEVLDGIAGSDPETFYSDLGVAEQVQAARERGGDVKLTPETFAKNMLLDDAQYQAIREHIRFSPDGVTLTEAKELPELAAEQARPNSDPAEQAGESVAADEAAAVALEPTPAYAPEVEQPVKFAEEQFGLQGLFQTAKEAGLTEPAYAEYLQKVAEAGDKSRQRQQMRLLKEQERQVSAEYVAEREKVREEMREHVSQSESVYAALNSIQLQRLDRDAVVRIIGKDGLEKLPKQKGRAIFAPKREGGVDPDLLADQYGFEGGDVMLFAMMDAPPIDEVIEAHTDAEMKKRHGDLLDRRQAVAAAIEELHNNDAQAQLLAYELAVLQQAKNAEAVSVKAFRERAKEGMLGETIGDIRSDKYLQTERRWAIEAGKLLRGGKKDPDTKKSVGPDRAGAAKAKFHQLLNYEYAREAFNVRRRLDRQVRHLKKLQNPKKEHPGVDAEAMDAIRSLLAGYDFSDRRVVKPGSPTTYRSLTLNEFNELYETTMTLFKQGTDARKVFRDGKMIEFAKVEQAILERLDELPTLGRAERAKKAQNARGFDPMRSTLAGARAKVAKVELLVRELDNGQVAGPVYDATVGEVHRARTKNLKMMRQHLGPIMDGLSRLSPAAKKRMDKSYFIKGLGREMLGSEIFMLALNTGSVSNLTKTIQGANKEEGRAQDWTPAGVDEAISKLGEEEGDLIQRIWDTFEAVRPQMEEIVRRKRGVTPERVQAREVRIGGVVRKGGYFPMVYDPSRVSRDKVPTDAFEAMKDPFTLDNVFSGMTKARIEKYSAPVLLDIGALPHALEGHLHFVSHFDAVDSVNQVLDSPAIKRAIHDKLGKEYYEEFKDWIGAVATSNSQRGNLGDLGRLMNAVRTHATIGYLGLSYGTLSAQALGVTTSIQQLGTDENGTFSVSEGAGWMLSGLETFLRNPVKTTKEVRAASGLMEFRVENFDRDFRAATQEAKSRRSRMWAKWGAAQRWAMSVIGTVQFFTVDMPTWLGAYNKAISLGREQQGAVEYANSIVRTSQSSGLTEDLTALQRSKNPAVQWATMFSTYTGLLFNLMLDTAATGVQGVRKRDPRKVAGAVTSLAVLLVATEIGSALLRREGPPEDEEDEAQWWALRIAAFAGSAVPIGGSYISAGLKDMQGGFAKVDAVFNSVPRAVRSFLKIFDPEEDVELADARKMFEPVAFLSGFPLTAPVRNILKAFEHWEEEGEVNLLDAVTGPPRVD